jgi:hypothetical protein
VAEPSYYWHFFSISNNNISKVIVTARTNASKPKLKQILYYEDTKLRRRGEVYTGGRDVTYTR